MSGKSGWVCPHCKHQPAEHVGGTCYFRPQFGSPSGHYCGWVYLGIGNAWHLEPGWVSGKELNEVALTMDKPPSEMFL